MHVNFGIMPPFEQKIRNKKERYAAYASRGKRTLQRYCDEVLGWDKPAEPAESDKVFESGESN